MMNGTTYILTEKVTGEETVRGRICYVIDMSFNPALSLTQDTMTCTITNTQYRADKTTTQYSNGCQERDPTLTTEDYKIASKENITVSARTFSCWKTIIIYDGSSNVTKTFWYSDKVKSVVKAIAVGGNTTMGLKS